MPWHCREEVPTGLGLGIVTLCLGCVTEPVLSSELGIVTLFLFLPLTLRSQLRTGDYHPVPVTEPVLTLRIMDFDPVPTAQNWELSPCAHRFKTGNCYPVPVPATDPVLSSELGIATLCSQV